MLTRYLIPLRFSTSRSLCALLLAGCVALSACRPAARQESGGSPLLVAAAANVSEAFEEIGAAFTRQSGVAVVFNFGSTAQLAQQIEHGATFDLFAAADVQHVDQLVASGKVIPQSRAVYARGRAVLWVPPADVPGIRTLRDLLPDSVKFVAIANPETAPYGAAAEQALRHEGLWEPLQPKLVRAENVVAAKQMAATGNTDAAFTAYSLVFRDAGAIIPLDQRTHPPIDQALGIPIRSTQQENARKFAQFILAGAGQEILKSSGYDPPSR